jgi:hypothetical protein
MLERQRKKFVGIGSFTGSRLLQSGTYIPASRSVRYRWSWISPALASYAISYAFLAFLLGCMIRPNILEKFDHFILMITVFK